MLDGLMNQTVIWWYKTAGSAYPSERTEASKTIKVRFERKRRFIRSADGREVVSEGMVYTKELVNPGDVIEYQGKRWPVLAIAEVVGLDGSAMWREVSV